MADAISGGNFAWVEGCNLLSVKLRISRECQSFENS